MRQKVRELELALSKTYQEIEKQMGVLKDEADRLSKEANYLISPHELRLGDGSWPMTDLLTAKASVLSALVELEKMK